MYDANSEEQKILEFWEKDKTFAKSVNERPENKPYVFYDGPPFATGLPHYGHILASVIKDVVPRYFTMKGFSVRRRWGWDCHGLPIESLVEKELNISGKKDIADKLGVDKFNNACRSKVLQYTEEWKKMVARVGRWVEFDNSYKTMDPTYMESVWWALKTIWDKNLIYEGRKVLMYCPHCETPVSKAEIAMDNSYKDITEEAVTARFKVIEPAKHGLPKNSFILAWTTTPWTLPGNVALAVGEKILYSAVELNGEVLIVADDLVEKIFVGQPARNAAHSAAGGEFKKIKSFPGNSLVGIKYEPLFDMPAMREAESKKVYEVVAADFVNTDEGTGVVHTAVVYGEDDYNLGMAEGLPAVPMLNDKGEYNKVAPAFLQGKFIKQAEKEIKKYLDEKGFLFAKNQNTHSYPHCWRCDTPLIYNAISAWFINIQTIKPRLIELNEKINWYPEHLKHGRFKNILETAPDWNISRNRYWATPLPFWKCANQESKKTKKQKNNSQCDNVVCVGSVAELKEKAINFSEVFSSDKVVELDLHKHIVDKIKLKCDQCGGSMERIPEVIDCWVESGSMPFAEYHYPFENKAVFHKRFPGQYIAEYINQTRAWFYYMHAMAGLLFDSNSFENCVTTGEIQNEKGEKLSKSKKNYPDPWIIIEKYGVDALRYYLMTSPVMEAENLLFNEREIREIYNKVVNILWNVVEFYKLYASESPWSEVPASPAGRQGPESKHVLDQWILAKLQILVKEATEQMDIYNTVKAARPIREFIDELSTWYVRRSRDRFKSENKADQAAALATLKLVLETLAKLMAPFTPFLAEKIWYIVTGAKTSVHLEMWPVVDEKYLNTELIGSMSTVRKLIETALSLRAEHKIKVRQPLASLQFFGFTPSKIIGTSEWYKIMEEELNVKKVSSLEMESGDYSNVSPGENKVMKEADGVKVILDINITPELKQEGLTREIIRTINQMRKEQKLTIQDEVIVKYATEDALLKKVLANFSQEILRATLAKKIIESPEASQKIAIDGAEINFSVEKNG
ncbi:MAG: isoleucine--tRNA ligase [Candidatus Magasanikbacteria bacterium]|nr:isoleucine--tRNA ligase [Candidatus Magasanikbacteria bacterium]